MLSPYRRAKVMILSTNPANYHGEHRLQASLYRSKWGEGFRTNTKLRLNEIPHGVMGSTKPVPSRQGRNKIRFRSYLPQAGNGHLANRLSMSSW